MGRFLVQNVNGDSGKKELLRESIYRHIRYSLGRDAQGLGPKELLRPVSLAIRDILIDGMLETERRYTTASAKRLYYLSMEFLIGRTLGDTLYNLKLVEEARQAVADFGTDLNEVLDAEPDAALGNGGLGRLAACFLESLATLGMPGFGYGIDYDYGLFKQDIVDGYQVEKPDRWKETGFPFYFERIDEPFLIPLYGRIENSGSNGTSKRIWVDYKAVIGVPHDLPVAGYAGKTVNWLRLFGARSSADFNLQAFNNGEYFKAVEEQISAENISRVLYPSDAVPAGKELRLLQEYFLVACSIKDIVRRYRAQHENFDAFASNVAIQMNDTHPSLAVAELMRVLVDGHNLEWKQAWEITEATLGYTNHTLLPEALEKWPMSLMSHVLPRHMQIISEINLEFLRKVEISWPGNLEKLRKMSIIEEGAEKQVRMANLAMVGSHSINGVSAIHTELCKTTLAPDFYALWPEKFNNKTNGIAPRRWVLKSNPGLSRLYTDALGDDWITDIGRLRELERFADDAGFRSDFLAIKQQNKVRLAEVIRRTTGTDVDPASLFDVQVKRIHEYKRQSLNVLRIIAEYQRLIEDGEDLLAPRTYIFAGKAAPGYWAAKQIIKLIHSVGTLINNDARVKDRLKVIFIPDYRVSLAEVIMPAADISEQISTAGMEASGTGNMKLSMNGALTLGTLDGANVEIMQEAGEENIYIFGCTVEELKTMREQGLYDPSALYWQDPRLKRAMDTLVSGPLSPDQPHLFRWFYDSVIHHGDRYFHLADLPSYLDASARAERDFVDTATWARKAILNAVRMAKFSSDRTIQEYAREIWKIETIHDSAQEMNSPVMVGE
ncbi:MAG TPA: glycogen/starch/alpha-glucan phosphorylase [Terriglobales bacterium]|nr:glycogen/starch/alpha-glucan phosphorylase [Terriglobales bacterium]